MDKVESAWLIEIPMRTFKGPPVWWTGCYSSLTATWSQDPMKAVRFARKEDADAVISGTLRKPFRDDAIATEHQWIGELRAAIIGEEE